MGPAVSVSETEEREPDLRVLMVAYQAGELAAFDKLYGLLAPKLRGYLSSLTWNPSLAEDLLQETFLQIHRSRRTYMPGRPVRPWAFAIARHVFLMDRRRAARRSKFESGHLDELPEIPVPPSIEQLGTRTDVRKALARLADDGREAVLLHHVWGFSFGEIGALLGIREGTAKLRAYRAINTLREMLSRETANEGGLHDSR